MKPLTQRQAGACENAKTDPARCRCRCGGAFHGKGRCRAEDRSALEALPAEDPHRIPTAEERAARAAAPKPKPRPRRLAQLALGLEEGA